SQVRIHVRRKWIQAQQELRFLDCLIVAPSQSEVMGVGVMGLFICRFELQRAFVFALRVSPLPLGIEQLIRERYVRFRQLWIDMERLQRSLFRKRERLVGG